MSGQDFFHLIRTIQSANDIVDVVGEHVALKRGGRNFTGLCPFHREKTPSFNVSPDKQIFKCFGCGIGGDVIKFVQNIMQVGFREAIEILAQRANIPIPDKNVRTGPVDGPSKMDLFKVNRWASEYYSFQLWNSPAAEPARKYLLDRGLEPDICRTYRLGFAPATGRAILEQGAKKGISPQLFAAAGLATARDNTFYDMFRGRIIFPIFEATGNVVGFGARTLGDDQPKYLNTPETAIFQKQRNLFGLHIARETIQETKQVVVVEGYTDCMAPYQAGIKNVVATLGTALTEQHVQNLRRYADRIVLVFDSDQAGQNAADRALNVFMTMGVEVKVAALSSGKDPCDLVISQGASAFQTVIDNSVDVLKYKWAQLTQRYNVSQSDREKRTAIEELLTALANCDPYGKIDVIQKGMVISRLASLLNVSADQLHQQMKRYRRRPSAYASGQRDEPTKDRNLLPAAETSADSAFRDLLEILLCEPGYIAGVAEVLSPEDFYPDSYRKIATYLWQCHNLLGEFALSELLGTVEEAEIADIITQLYRQGNQKGNFAETLEDAMRCVKDYHREQAAARIAADLQHALTDEEMDRQLQALHENLQIPMRRTPGALAD